MILNKHKQFFYIKDPKKTRLIDSPRACGKSILTDCFGIIWAHHLTGSLADFFKDVWDERTSELPVFDLLNKKKKLIQVNCFPALVKSTGNSWVYDQCVSCDNILQVIGALLSLALWITVFNLFASVRT